jgi:tetratricopeptide (TPR) repeat protein
VLGAAEQEDVWFGQVLNNPFSSVWKKGDLLNFQCTNDGLHWLPPSDRPHPRQAKSVSASTNDPLPRNPRTEAAMLLQEGKYEAALRVLHEILSESADDWNAIYLAGQCHRFLRQYKAAIGFLRHAARLQDRDPSILLALGIALQLDGELRGAEEAFLRAVRLDPDYAEAYNSLALTLKKAGVLQRAVETYDLALEALSRRMVRAMTNDINNPILEMFRTRHDLWTEHALYGATWWAALAGGAVVAFPTGAQALEEERTRRHRGLYYRDYDEPNKRVRLFLPNYFNTFARTLFSEGLYAHLAGNKGTALATLGREEEARRCIEEAEDFTA